MRGSIQGLPLWPSLLQAHRLHAPGWCAARGRVEWAFACILTVSSVADARFTVGIVDSDAYARVEHRRSLGILRLKSVALAGARPSTRTEQACRRGHLVRARRLAVEVTAAWTQRSVCACRSRACGLASRAGGRRLRRHSAAGASYSSAATVDMVGDRLPRTPDRRGAGDL